MSTLHATSDTARFPAPSDSPAEFENALKYFSDINSLFPSRIPPTDNLKYHLNASLISFINENPPTDEETLLAAKRFVEGRLSLTIISSRQNPFPAAGKTTAQLPMVDMLLMGDGVGYRPICDVSGTLRIDPTTETSPQIVLVHGPELDKKFGTIIHFDPDSEAMTLTPIKDAQGSWGPVRHAGIFTGKIILPPSVPPTELIGLRRKLQSDPNQISSRPTTAPTTVVWPEPDGDSDDGNSLASTSPDTETTNAGSVS